MPRGQENHPVYGPTGDYFELEIKPTLREAHKSAKRIDKGGLKRFLISRGLIEDKNEWYFHPDDAYYYEDTNEVIIYEMKSQCGTGSAHEKLTACDWHLRCYKEWLSQVGIPPENVHMFYILNDWFKKPKFRSLLKYMKDTECDYCFWWDNDSKKEEIVHFHCK